MFVASSISNQIPSLHNHASSNSHNLINLCQSHDSTYHPLLYYVLTTFPLHFYVFMLFHPSPYFSISFEIVNKAKLLHHYLTCSSSRIVFDLFFFASIINYCGDGILFLCCICPFRCASVTL
jgi:hypothetical protein